MGFLASIEGVAPEALSPPRDLVAIEPSSRSGFSRGAEEGPGDVIAATG